MFDVCMWECDRHKMSSVWTPIYELLSWNSLGGKHPHPPFRFDGQAHLLGLPPPPQTHWPTPSGLDAAQPDRASSVVSFTAAHTRPSSRATTHQQLCYVVLTACQHTVMFSLIAVVNRKRLGCSSWPFGGSLVWLKGFPGSCCVFFIIQGKNVYSQTYLRKYLPFPATQICQRAPKHATHLVSWNGTVLSGRASDLCVKFSRVGHLSHLFNVSSVFQLKQNCQ